MMKYPYKFNFLEAEALFLCPMTCIESCPGRCRLLYRQGVSYIAWNEFFPKSEPKKIKEKKKENT